MLIKKHQSGGIAYIPTTYNRGEAQQASSSDKDNKNLAKELISLVKEKGLDSDVSVLLDRYDQIVRRSGDPYGGNIQMTDFTSLLRLSSSVKQNYEAYEDARKNLTSQDAWGEVATDARGHIYVQNSETGDLDLVSSKEYLDNNNKYLALTNSDVMNIRRSNSDQAFKNNIIDDIAQSIGMKSITDYVNKIIKEFGTTEINGMSEKRQNQIRSGIEELLGGSLNAILEVGADGLYKITTKQTIADTGLKEALNYIVSALPTNYRNTLNAKSAVEGYDAPAMLATIIYANTDRTIDLDYDSTASKAAGYETGSDSSKKDEDTLAERVAKGDLPQFTMKISPKAKYKSDIAVMEFTAWDAFRPVSDNGNALNKNNLEELVPEIAQLKGADISSASFGGQKINAVQLSALVYDGESNVVRMALPYKLVDGKKTPDFDLLAKLNILNKYKKDHPGVSDLEMRRKYGEYESEGIYWNEETKQYDISTDRIGLFLSISAYASKDLLDIDKEYKDFLEDVPRDIGMMFKDEYNRLVQYGKMTHSKNDVAKNKYKNAGANSFVHGNVYFAIDEMQAVNLTKNQTVPRDQYENFNKKSEIGHIISNGQKNASYKSNFE